MASSTPEKAVAGDKLPEEKPKKPKIYTNIRFSEFNNNLYMFVDINGETYFVKLIKVKKYEGRKS